MRLICILMLGAALLAACTVNVSPPLGTSLGMRAFESMKVIERHNISVGLYIDPKLRSYKVTATIRSGNYEFNLGEALSTKLIKALAYQFNRVKLAGNLADAKTEDAIFIISLKDIDVQLKAVSGWTKVEAKSYVRLALRAELRDTKNNRIVWVGTTDAKEELVHEEMGEMQYQEAGRGFARAIDRAIDHAIGDILAQMAKSANFKKYVNEKEGKQRV